MSRTYVEDMPVREGKLSLTTFCGPGKPGEAPRLLQLSVHNYGKSIVNGSSYLVLTKEDAEKLVASLEMYLEGLV